MGQNTFEWIIGGIGTVLFSIIAFYVARLYRRIDALELRLRDAEVEAVKIKTNYNDKFNAVHQALADTTAALIAQITKTETLIITEIGKINTRCAGEDGRINLLQIQIDNLKEKLEEVTS
jgi:hypothetical protein